MGKMKRSRKKLHTAAKNSKTKKQNDTPGEDAMAVDHPDQTIVLSPFVAPSAPNNPFSGLKITTDVLKQNLPEFDARSTITSKSFKGMGLKKKEKQKVRHELWMQKMNALQAEKLKQKERKRKQKTAIVGDLTDLQDTLPTLELLLKKNTGKSFDKDRPVAKPKGIQKETKRRKQMLDDIELFKQVVNHPAYRDNPTETISKHLHNKMQQSETDT